MYSASQIRKTFNSFIAGIPPAIAGKSTGDFTRNRLCNLENTLKCLITMSGHTISSEIGYYFNLTGNVRPSASAFCQQRGKLNDDLLPHLFSGLNNCFTFNKTFKGLHLMAVDGSDLNIPALAGDESTFVPFNSGNGGYHQMHLDALFDILEGRYFDARVTPRARINERSAFCDMISANEFPGTCLFIGDRGYPSLNILAYVISYGHFFLFRAKDPAGHSSLLKNINLPPEDIFDMDHHFVVSRRKNRHKDPAVYKYVRWSFDLIPPEDKTSVFEMDLRIIRTVLETGSTEYLLTNLPRDKFPASVVTRLYGSRWSIETSFLNLKYKVALTSFHSKRRDFIVQEVYARLIAFNLIVLLTRSVKLRQSDTKYIYKIAFSDSVAYCYRFLLTRMPGTQLKNLLSSFCKTPIRPNRKFNRNVKSQRLKTLNNRF